MNSFATGASIPGRDPRAEDMDHVYQLRLELARLRRAQAFGYDAKRAYRISVIEDEIDEFFNAEELA